MKYSSKLDVISLVIVIFALKRENRMRLGIKNGLVLFSARLSLFLQRKWVVDVRNAVVGNRALPYRFFQLLGALGREKRDFSSIF